MSSPRRVTARAVMAARCAFAGVVLYAIIDTALVFLRPQFSILHNAESDYGSGGPWAWLMDLNFLLRCGLSLAVVGAVSVGAAKSRRLQAALGLLSVWALGSGLLAFFPDDPAGTPLHTAGAVHLAIAFVAFVAVLGGAILGSMALQSQPRWRRVGIPMAALAWGALVPLLLLGRVGFRPHSLGGLYEKIFLGMELLWLALVAARVAQGSGDASE
ncbi:MAG: DUF998 domain-containing protein [Candidatus Dormiibacterota bacterium]